MVSQEVLSRRTQKQDSVRGRGVGRPIFEWFLTTALNEWVNGGVWQFAVIESVHLLGLCLLGGSLLVVDLRLLGIGLTGQPIGELEAQARPWLVAALVLMVVTGVPMLVALPMKYYFNASFWVKVTTLPFALLFVLTVRARVAGNAGEGTTPRTRLVGAISIALWLTVAAAGRWIGFS